MTGPSAVMDASADQDVCRLQRELIEAQRELLRLHAERADLLREAEERFARRIARSLDALAQAVGGVNAVHNIQMASIRETILQALAEARGERSDLGDQVWVSPAVAALSKRAEKEQA